MRVKSFKAACKHLGKDATLPEFPNASPKQKRSLLAEYQLTIIAEALNDGWEADWSNTNQPKYQLYFSMNPKKFSLCFVVGRFGASYVPSRLCFRGRQTAEYAAKTFLKLFKQYMLG